VLRRRGIDDARLFAGVEFALLCSPAGRALGIDGAPALCLLALLQLALTFLGLQITQPSSVLQRCFFVYLLLSYSVVTLAVTSLY